MKYSSLLLVPFILFSFTFFEFDRKVSPNIFAPESDMVLSGSYTYDYVEIPIGVTIWIEDDLSIESRSDIVINGSVICLSPLVEGKSLDGFTISFITTNSIMINGTLLANDGLDSHISFVAGGHGGNITLEATEILLNQNLSAGNGGNGGLNAAGGDGGNILIFGKTLSSASEEHAIKGGNGGKGGNGESGKNGYDGGKGGNGGNAIILAPGTDGAQGTHGSDDIGSDGPDGYEFDPCTDGIPGFNGGDAIAGNAGDGGEGGDATAPGGNGGTGGNGGNGGRAYGGDGGHGGDGSDCTTGPAGNGVNGSWGGFAVAGLAGGGGFGGHAFVEGFGGHGGHGGIGGSAFPGSGGNGGSGGNSTAYDGGDGGDGGPNGEAIAANGGFGGLAGNGAGGLDGGTGGNGGNGGFIDVSWPGNGGDGGNGNTGGTGGLAGNCSTTHTVGIGRDGGPGGSPNGIDGEKGSDGIDHGCLVATDGSDGITLPVELLDFSVQQENQIITFHWQTAAELNNKGFEIQESADAIDWITIGFVESKGTTSENQNYSYTYLSSKNRTCYYRLGQLDFDGNFKFSDIVSLYISDQPVDILVYPNPGKGTINIQLKNNKIEYGRIEVFSYTGKLIHSQKLIPSRLPDHSFTIDLQFLPPGNYILNSRINGEKKARKIIIQ